jgi:hypothetical protein
MSTTQIPTLLPTPVIMTVNYIITSFLYNVSNLILFTSSDIRVSLVDDTGIVQTRIFYKLEGTEYSSWGVMTNILSI